MQPDAQETTSVSCSVVVCTRDRPAQLDQCLEAIAQLDYPRFDVLVVDNAPQNGGVRDIAARRGARYLVEPRPGENAARNCGARACQAEIVAYLDDDALCEPRWLSQLVAEFRDPRVMAVTGRILPLRVETEAEKLFLQAGGFDPGQGRRVVDRERPFWFELANFGGIGNEAGMAFRRQAFDVWPGFDERLGYGAAIPGATGHYAFFGLIERGYRVVYTPQAVVYHPYPRTLEELRARHLRTLVASAGYLTLLFFEHRRYRGAVMRFLAEWLRGLPRAWRRQVAPRPPIVPRWRELMACLPGPLLYFRTLCQRKQFRG
jgi:GT2 family glycosyltransferase